MNRRSAVFLDLNGTLVEPVVVDCPDELTLIAGADFAVASLCVPASSVQSLLCSRELKRGLSANSIFVSGSNASLM